MSKKFNVQLTEQGDQIYFIIDEAKQIKLLLDENIEFLKKFIKVEQVGQKIILKILNKPICYISKFGIEVINKLSSTEIRTLYELLRDKNDENNLINAGILNNSLWENKSKIKTELHTHLITMLSDKELVDFSKKYNIELPFLNGVLNFEKGINKSIFELSEKELYSLMSSISIDLKGKTSFDELEKVIANRNFIISRCIKKYSQITKYDQIESQQRVILDLLKTGLKSLQKQGIRYTEISYSNINTLLFLSKSDYSDIKGIDFKFLKSIDRTDPAKEFRMAVRLADNLELYFEDKVIGIDIMGNEEPLSEADFDANFSQSFYNKLYPLVISLNKVNNSVLRLHAGEFRDATANVYASLKIIDIIVSKTNIIVPPPIIRIGHGINIDRNNRVIELLKKFDCIVELNISSNYALSNIENFNNLPLKYYQNNGIKYVISTDGAGMYRTSNLQEKNIFKAILKDDNESYLFTETEYLRSIK